MGCICAGESDIEHFLTDFIDELKIRNRFNEYETKTAVLKDYYQDQNKYFGVDGIGSIDVITKRLCEIIDKL